MPGRAMKGQAEGELHRGRGNSTPCSPAAPPPPVMAFPYYGGKIRHLPFLFKCLPEGSDFHFVDVFGGSGAVALNMVPRYHIVTYNDIDKRLVHFFTTLRDSPHKLIQAIEWTPYAREEFMLACINTKGGEDIGWLWEDHNVEYARQFYAQLCLSYGNLPNQVGMRFAKDISIGTPPSKTFARRRQNLEAVVERMKDMQIENKDAADMIRTYDTPNTLFYIDPPYVPDSRVSNNDYLHDMTEQDHIDLCELLRSCDASIIISGYRSELYDNLYADWERIDDKAKGFHHSAGRVKGATRQESIWRNYSVDLPLLDSIEENTNGTI